LPTYISKRLDLAQKVGNGQLDSKSHSLTSRANLTHEQPDIELHVCRHPKMFVTIGLATTETLSAAAVHSRPPDRSNKVNTLVVLRATLKEECCT
jgi:hypothetical protein